MFLDAITENEVATEIGPLDVNKSGGHDEISPEVVKAVLEKLMYKRVVKFFDKHSGVVF